MWYLRCSLSQAAPLWFLLTLWFEPIMCLQWFHNAESCTYTFKLCLCSFVQWWESKLCKLCSRTASTALSVKPPSHRCCLEMRWFKDLRKINYADLFVYFLFFLHLSHYWIFYFLIAWLLSDGHKGNASGKQTYWYDHLVVIKCFRNASSIQYCTSQETIAPINNSLNHGTCSMLD